MSTDGKKIVSILDIHLPELELELEKAYFCRTWTWTCKNEIRELELELGLAKIGWTRTRIKFDRVRSLDYTTTE